MRKTTIQRISFNGNFYLVSNERPSYKDGYVHMYEDSTGVHIGHGIRLETNETKESHKNCMKIIGTNHQGLNLEGVPTMDGIAY